MQTETVQSVRKAFIEGRSPYVLVNNRTEVNVP